MSLGLGAVGGAGALGGVGNDSACPGLANALLATNSPNPKPDFAHTLIIAATSE
jgi:hypothetical protein